MARTFKQPKRTYQPGIYGPFAVDSFVREDTDYLELSLTVPVGGWTPATPLLRITMQWQDGQGAMFEVNGGEQLDKNNVPQLVATYRAHVPQLADGKAAVTSGTVVIEAFAPVTTALTFRAG